MPRSRKPTEHPAKFSDEILDVIAERLMNILPPPHRELRLLDPCGGVGKVGLLRERMPPYQLHIHSNDIQKKWAKQAPTYGCDEWTTHDATALPFPVNSFDLIVTSPTYGNRMADHHEARDGSKRFSYYHCHGSKLSPRNTGLMPWGKDYRRLHREMLAEFYRVLQGQGRFVLNISDHIKTVQRDGEKFKQIQRVSAWWAQAAMDVGFQMVDWTQVATPRLRRGANWMSRMDHENIFMFVLG